MSDSEDDRPLVKAKSKSTISKGTAATMNSSPANKPNGTSANSTAHTNGTVKRKSLGNSKSYKELSSDDEDDIPMKKKRKTAAEDSDDEPLVKKVVVPVAATSAPLGDLSEDDMPLTEKLQKKQASLEKQAEKEAKAARQKDAAAKRKSKAADSDDDDVPLVKKKRASTNGTKKIKKEDSDDDEPLAKKSPAAKKAVKKETPAKKSKAKLKSEEPEDEEGDDEGPRWWEAEATGDGTIKWTTLEHNGVVFPPDYQPLPKNVNMLYDGQPVTMAPEAEEIAYAFGSMLNSEHNVSNPVFQQNFFHDFKEALDKTGGAKDRKGEKVKIMKFEKCDFTKIFEHVDAERTAKKAMSTAEKKAIKAEKDEKEAPFLYCVWDGRKQKVGNFRVEPPGLFRGRGEHPKTGHFKKRVAPEQITINIGKDAMVPKPPQGHKWKEVRHDQTGTWLAMWQENINGNYKYVMLAANSDVKGQSDHKKFEKARELKKHIDVIRKDYGRELKSQVMAERQRATAVYLIDKFALRAGNEKGEDEADTVGCCSLKFEHITLKPPETVIFDFLGKDSIRYYDEKVVDAQVFKNLKIFKREPKKEGDDIFDRLTTSSLNKHLSNYMPGLTAKVFRTFNASFTMSRMLKEEMAKLKPNATIPEKIKAYNDANRDVAILCNHKRTVGAGHAQQMEKLDDKIKSMRFEQWRLKQMILDIDPKLKKKRAADYFKRPDEFDDEWIVEHHKALVEAERVKITKKFEKENEKLQAEGKSAQKDSELRERLQKATELETKFKQERKTGKIPGTGKSVEGLDKQIEKLDVRIQTTMLQSEDRESNKEVALGTSKINYIDPRLTVVFSKKYDVPIEKFFSKTLREKFEWAIQSAGADWQF